VTGTRGRERLEAADRGKGKADRGKGKGDMTNDR
jgi:hypothetical protein